MHRLNMQLEDMYNTHISGNEYGSTTARHQFL